MKRIFFAITLFVLAMTILSCASAPRSVQQSQIAPLPAAPPAPAEAGRANTGITADKSTAAPITERMIVRTVSLGLEVQDPEKSFDDVAAIAAKYKGYVSNTNSRRDSKNRLVGTITLRIPADSLDKALKELKTASLKVLTENANANDVTDQYTDLNARLKNLEATEVELQKLLATVRERTGKAEEILAVYDKLTQIRQQIEQIKGQINVIDRTTTLATVTVQLTPHDDIQILEPETWLPNRTAAQALKSLVQALQGLGDITIWLVLFLLPLLIIFLIPFAVFALIVRAWMKSRKKKREMATA